MLADLSLKIDREIDALDRIRRAYPFVPCHNIVHSFPDISWHELCKYHRDCICIDPEQRCPVGNEDKCEKYLSLTGLKRYIIALFSSTFDEDYKDLVAHMKATLLPEKSLKVWAHELHITPSCLSKLIKETHKCSYREVCTRYKMHRAVELLKTTHRTIKQIASELGYHYSNDFSRAFRRAFGLSPSEYRSRHRYRTGSKGKR